MFGESSFYEDLVEDLSGTDWRDLSIDPEVIFDLDPTPKDDITPQDADFIARTLIDDERYSDFYDYEIQRYYMGHLGLQWDSGEGARNVSAEGWMPNRTGNRTIEESNEYVL